MGDVLQLLDDEYEVFDERNPFDDAVKQLLVGALEARRKVAFTEEEVDALVAVMLQSALKGQNGTTFQTNQIYASATGNQWTKIEPSVRKSIGKRFRAAVEAHAKTADEGDAVITLLARNINNAAVYERSTIPRHELP
ncbi:hypothetical protein [Paraburkholderia piptadeniae]|uniref:hypothetical protein n=1 Tax=Paraburkholderia piptadeniae TaxID=1701573 RepID=UPI000B401260|nr:hypothetical protein [Paraburkholderia piptadeniae]